MGSLCSRMCNTRRLPEITDTPVSDGRDFDDLAQRHPRSRRGDGPTSLRDATLTLRRPHGAAE